MRKKKLMTAAETTNKVPKDRSVPWIPKDATLPVHIEERAEAEISPNQTLWEQFWSIFRHNKLALVSLILIIVIIIACYGAPLFAPYDPIEQHLQERLAGPSAEHLLGQDQFGRDILSRMMYAGRISLFIGFVPTILSLVLGAVLGIIAGFSGKLVDAVIMRLADICLAFPSLLLAMVFAYALGKGIIPVFIALTMVNWAGTARLVRSEVLSLREKEYVEAATSIGVKRGVIMLRHIFPNCIPTLIVLFTNNIPGSILTESSLSFLGVGAQPPQTSWGKLVYDMRQYLDRSPVATLAPGVIILILVVAFNFLGDAIRDKFDPRLQEQ